MLGGCFWAVSLFFILYFLFSLSTRSSLRHLVVRCLLCLVIFACDGFHRSVVLMEMQTWESVLFYSPGQTTCSYLFFADEFIGMMFVIGEQLMRSFVKIALILVSIILSPYCYPNSPSMQIRYTHKATRFSLNPTLKLISNKSTHIDFFVLISSAYKLRITQPICRSFLYTTSLSSITHHTNGQGPCRRPITKLPQSTAHT